MATHDGVPEKQKFDQLSKSQQESAYFNMDQTYDPAVYETDAMGYLRITGMLMIFYLVMGVHWWANFSLGIHATTTALWY